MDGPNHELNFEKHILSAHNTREITNYLRFSKGDEAKYLGHLEYYLPILEGTDVYDEFKKDYDELVVPEVKPVGNPVTETVVGEITVPLVESTVPLVESTVPLVESTVPLTDPLTEDEFLDLSAKEQKALVTATEENDGSNEAKRYALYIGEETV